MHINTRNIKGWKVKRELVDPIEIDNMVVTHVLLAVLPQGSYTITNSKEIEVEVSEYFWFTNKDGVKKRLSLEKGYHIKVAGGLKKSTPKLYK